MELIIVFATVVIAIATVYYAWQTHKLLKETRRSVDEMNRPEVVVFLNFVDGITQESDSSEDYYCKLSFCVRNVGTRVARKVRFEGDFSFQPAKGSSLSRIEFIKKGIEILPPGIDVVQVVSHSNNFFEIYDPDYYQDKSSKVEISVEYLSSGGTLYNDLFALDFLQLLEKQPKVTTNE